MPKPSTIDEYLAGISPERRSVLEKLRRSIRGIVPNAEECISYSMPAFRVQGHVVAGFLATQNGYSYYPFSGSVLGTLGDEIARYDHTKSALHFDANQPPTLALLRKLLKARIAETARPSRKVANGKAILRSKRVR